MGIKTLFKKLINELDMIGDVYDVIRLIDPVRKKVVFHSKKEVSPDDKSKCFSFWDRNLSCENCISMRAMNLNKSVVKIEYKDPKVYLITALPVANKDEKMVAELFKDITQDGIIEVDGSAGEIALIIARKNISIVRDAFTRVYNEMYIEERLPVDIEKALAEKRTLGLFVIDIKNLDRINDLNGFQKGDELIRKFAAIIKGYCRKAEDWAARSSGAGFLLVMYDVDNKQAYRLCKRINDKLKKVEFSNGLTVESKIGFAVLENAQTTAEQLILKASNNIYSGIDEISDKSNETLETTIFPRFLLTEREREVAVLLLKGRSNNEIAAELFVGISTVKKHVSNIFEKASVGSRAEFISKVKG